MASQAQPWPKHAPPKHEAAAVNGAGEEDSTCTSDSMSVIDQHSAEINGQGRGMLNALLKPDQQQGSVAKLYASHPKLWIFLGLNVAISGVPLIVFSVFALSVGLSALTIGVTIGLLGAGVLTVTCVGFALTILIPTICLTTCVACSLAFWILVGLYILQWVFGPSDQASKSSRDTVTESLDKSYNTGAGQWPTEFRQIVSARKEVT